MNKKIGIIIQARMGSTRLPNKIMLDLAGKPVLWHVVERCKKANVDEVIVATSINKENDIIEKFCKENDYLCFRGNEDDVLKRYYECAKKFDLNTIIRVTGDCPLISPEIINCAIKKFKEKKVDYMSNVAKRSFPRGLDVEVFSFNTLKKANNLAKDKFYREHVTAFIYNNPKIFKINDLIAEGILKRSDIRICIDTKKDLNLLTKIYTFLYTGKIIPIEEVIKFLDKNSKLIKMNLESEKEQRNQNIEENVKQEFLENEY